MLSMTSRMLSPRLRHCTILSAGKGIKFETKLDNMTTEILIGDQLRLQQVILNLFVKRAEVYRPVERLSSHSPRNTWKAIR